MMRPVFDSKLNDILICDGCHRIHVDDQDSEYPICECSRPFDRMDELTIEDIATIRDLLWDFAASGVPFEDDRLGYVEIQVAPETIRRARDHFGMNAPNHPTK